MTEGWHGDQQYRQSNEKLAMVGVCAGHDQCEDGAEYLEQHPNENGEKQ